MRATTLCVSALLVVAALSFAGTAVAHGECNPYASSCGEFDDPADGTNTAADHHHPDCEQGQPAAGSDPETGEGGLNLGVAFVCEGEHWDGDDHAQPSGGPNEIHITDLSDEKLVIAVNDGPGDEAPAGVSDPVHLRVSGKGDNDVYNEPSDASYLDDLQGHLYVHVAVLLVGETGVGLDGDGGSLDPGDAGNTLGQARVAWYGEDHTELIFVSNVIATPISLLGITRGHVANDDCDFETYENTRDTRACGRDNTAISAELAV